MNVGDPASATLGNLGKINHIVVLMLENRSFDHVLGALKAQNPAIAGALDNEFSNLTDPAVPTSPVVPVGPASAYAMPFDPGHEFEDVQIQLYGRIASAARKSAPRIDPAPMSGFVYSAEEAAKAQPDAGMVMQSFHPEKLPILATLATEFALFNYWHSSLPGPTWPNRFFAHAGTSGGLSDSPTDPDIIQGFTFPAGTLFSRLADAHKQWRIYHDGLPQTAGIDSLRTEYLNIFTKNFRDMSCFEGDLRASHWPEYVFIEPSYDTGHNYVNGNSMHPLNDIRKGERLIKRVYEAIRASRIWPDTLLLITCDEHGGFFDHVSPPVAIPPGGDQRYNNPANNFAFDLLGVRVPAIAVSAYTAKNTVIGRSPQDRYDHTSILSTVEKRFGLAALRDRDAVAPTVAAALNADSPRLSAAEAPMTLPTPVADGFLTRVASLFQAATVDEGEPLSPGQRVQLTLAHACDLQILDPVSKLEARHRYLGIRRRGEAADYIKEVEQRIRERRKSPPSEIL
jgi:phospholipase C